MCLRYFQSKYIVFSDWGKVIMHSEHNFLLLVFSEAYATQPLLTLTFIKYFLSTL